MQCAKHKACYYRPSCQYEKEDLKSNANSIRKEPSSNRGPDESLKSLGARAAKELRRQVRERQDRIHANLSYVRLRRHDDLQDLAEAERLRGFPKRASRQNKPGNVGDSEA